MTARRSDSSAKRSSSAKSASARVKAESNAPDQLGALQQQLTRQLQQTVEDTISAVCDDFQHKFCQLQARVSGKKAGGAASTAAAQLGAASTADYEMYYSCCKRLVAYIAANMTTSPDFAAQMDRIILACHSKAPERVLRTVATKNVWFHRRDGPATAADAVDNETDDDAPVERPTRAAAAVKHSPRQIKQERVSPARPARAARKVAEAPPTRSAAAKRRLPSVPEPPVAKRQRPTRRSLPLPDYDDDDDEEEEEEEEVVEEEEEEDDDDDNAHDSADSASNQPHLEVSDELLDFKDHVRDLCYVDKRTPVQTKFFKERLRKAILFVDAQLCKPPPGKVCGCDCKKIRAVMCDRTLPCRNKICRVWHDVEVHIDRCENTHCELKNRIMLRETMHKIDHKKLQITSAKAEVAAKKTQRDAIKRESVTAANDRELFIELTLLTNEIEQLESEIAAAEEELGILNGTKKAFWACLNVVGIELKDDVADGFPDLAMHYVTKKQAAPRARAPKRAAKDLEAYVSEPPAEQELATMVSSQPTTDDVGLNDDGAFGPMAPITRRTTRRSTTKTFEAMSMDVVSVESDDEAKRSEPVDVASGADGATDAVADAPTQQPPVAGESEATGAPTPAPVVAVDSVNTVEAAADDASSEFPATQNLSDLSDLLPQSSASSVEAVDVTTECVDVTTTTTTTTTTVVVTQEVALSSVETATTTVESISSSAIDTASTVVPPAPVAFPDAPPSPVNNIQILPSIGASATPAATKSTSASDTDAYAQLLAAATHASTNPSV